MPNRMPLVFLNHVHLRLSTTTDMPTLCALNTNNLFAQTRVEIAAAEEAAVEVVLAKERGLKPRRFKEIARTDYTASCYPFSS